MLQDSLVNFVRRELQPALATAHKERTQHDDEKLAWREEALARQLRAVVERYASALELFDQWKNKGAPKTKQEQNR